MKNAGINMTVRIGIVTLILVLCVAVQGSVGRVLETGMSPRHEPAKIQAAMRNSARSLGLQTQIPISGDKQITPEKHPLDRFIPRWNGVSAGAEFLFYASLVVIVLVVLMTWRDNLWSASRAKRMVQGAEIGGPGAAEVSERMGKAQLEADELAACDNFAEAMHVLLLRSVDELRRHLSVSIAISLTSREIQRRIGLPPEGGAAFADIIDRVEISYFGTHLPGADDYAACRNSFDSLTKALRQFSVSSAQP